MTLSWHADFRVDVLCFGVPVVSALTGFKLLCSSFIFSSLLGMTNIHLLSYTIHPLVDEHVSSLHFGLLWVILLGTFMFTSLCRCIFTSLEYVAVVRWINYQYIVQSCTIPYPHPHREEIECIRLLLGLSVLLEPSQRCMAIHCDLIDTCLRRCCRVSFSMQMFQLCIF